MHLILWLVLSFNFSCETLCIVASRLSALARYETNVHQEYCMSNVFISKIEPQTVNNALEHSDCVVAMQSELAEFERNKVWRLISKSDDAVVV